MLSCWAHTWQLLNNDIVVQTPSLLACLPSGLWDQCENWALPSCLEEVHWQLHLIDSFIIALLMITFPILSVQLFSSLWFQLLIIPHQSALIWWGSQQSYCFPHLQLLLSAPPQPTLHRLHAEQQIISTEEATDILTHKQKAVTKTEQYDQADMSMNTQKHTRTTQHLLKTCFFLY